MATQLHRATLLWVLIWLLSACRDPDEAPPELLVDRTAAVGLDFVHHNGMSGDLFFSEILGPGSALFDADNDGDLDLYLVQGQMLGAAKTLADAVIPWKGEESPSDRLFRNELEAGALRFTDITSTSGLVSAEYGMGVAAGDIDNDGWTDLYVTNFGANRLWRNQGLDEQGQVTFRDLTAETGTGDERWSTSAAFLDFDRDGWLDLYVVNYTDFRLTNHQTCFTDLGRTDYCGPKTYRPETDRLFRNLGPGPDGHVEFADVSAEAGLLAAPGPGLGVITVDVDGDGWLDIYVANDQARNHLWINRGVAGSAPTLFREEALERGCAVDSQGRVQASMGVEAGDVDRDGSPDLFMTHLLREVNTLYLNDGRGRFDDRSAASGLAGPSIGMTGFGAAMLDIEGDGWLDVLTVNGEVRIIKAQRLAGDPLPLRQPNQLFLNREGRFVDVSDRVPALTVAGVSRGAAVGDVDNDGDPDVVVNNNSEAVQLLINPRDGGAAHWLGLRLVTETGRDALGALVTLTRENEPPLIRWSRTDSSFLVARDPRVVFGLGSNPAVDRVVVRWPNGTHEVFDQLEVDCYQTLRAGDGRPIAELSG